MVFYRTGWISFGARRSRSFTTLECSRRCWKTRMVNNTRTLTRTPSMIVSRKNREGGERGRKEERNESLKRCPGNVVARNGGVPQLGNLTKHLQVFRDHLINQIPDKSFPGVGVIDFESWRPIFRQNWASLQPYKKLSVEVVRREHPFWDDQRVEQEAKRRFEKYGQLFMEETLKAAKRMRPAANWGYYAYPYCYNLTPNQPSAQCEATTMQENDKYVRKKTKLFLTEISGN